MRMKRRGGHGAVLFGGKVRYLVWLDQTYRQILRARRLLEILGLVVRVLFKARVPVVLRHGHRVKLLGQVLILRVLLPGGRASQCAKPVLPTSQMASFSLEDRI